MQVLWESETVYTRVSMSALTSSSDRYLGTWVWFGDNYANTSRAQLETCSSTHTKDARAFGVNVMTTLSLRHGISGTTLASRQRRHPIHVILTSSIVTIASLDDVGSPLLGRPAWDGHDRPHVRCVEGNDVTPGSDAVWRHQSWASPLQTINSLPRQSQLWSAVLGGLS